MRHAGGYTGYTASVEGRGLGWDGRRQAREGGKVNDDRHFERVFADPPAESDILGYPIGNDRKHPVWRAIGIAVLAACGATVLATLVLRRVRLRPGPGVTTWD